MPLDERHGHGTEKRSAQRGKRSGLDLVDAAGAADLAVARRSRVAAGGPVGVVGDQRAGLALVDLEALAHGVFFVVLAQHQLFTRHVVAARPNGVPALTAARSMSPVEICGMPYFWQMKLACVPLPAPGAPNRISLIACPRHLHHRCVAPAPVAALFPE